MEAARYTLDGKEKRKGKKSTDGGKIYHMAFSNLLRSKKRTFLALLSMSLSVILLNSTVSLAGRLRSVQEYVQSGEKWTGVHHWSHRNSELCKYHPYKYCHKKQGVCDLEIDWNDKETTDPDVFWFTSYRFTILPALVVSPCLLLLGILVPWLTEKYSGKDSIVEQLRKTE